MWLIEWIEWNEETASYMACSDSWDDWADVVRVVADCVIDPYCKEYSITCFE